MKKIELSLGILSFIAVAVNSFIHAGTYAVLISLSALAMFYMYLSFALFTTGNFKIFEKKTYKTFSVLQLIGTIITGIILSTIIVGFLFKILNWPGATIQLGIGLTGVTVVSLIALIKYSKTKSEFYSSILKRTALYGCAGLLFMVLM